MSVAEKGLRIKLIPQTNQEAFDLAVRHLATMKRRCAVGGACRYRRHATSEKCVVGAMIRDDDYHPSLEGLGVRERVGDGDIVSVGVSVDLLSDLQRAHDLQLNWSYEGFDGWPSIHAIAQAYGLTIPDLSQM